MPNATSYESARSINIYLDATRTNLITNPSFETNATGWFAGANTTIARSNTQAYADDYSLQLTATAGGDVRAETAAAEDGFSAEEGQYYTFSAYVISPDAARSFSLGLTYYNVNALPVPEVFSAPVVASTSEWTRLSLSVQAPAAAATGQVSVQATGLGAGEPVYIDAAMVEPSEFLSEYFDGGSLPHADFLWANTAHESVSYYYPRREIKDYRLRTVLPDYLPLGRTYRTFYGQEHPA